MSEQPYLSLFACPAPRPFKQSWRSPLTLAVTGYMGGQIRAIVRPHVARFDGATSYWPALAREPIRYLGHVFVGITRENHTVYYGVRAFDAAASYHHMVTRDKVGFAVMYSTWAGGLETQSLLRSLLAERRATGRVAELRFPLRQTEVASLEEYESSLTASRMVTHHGGCSLWPDDEKGTGCGAFAMSFLQRTQKLQPWMEQHWTARVRIPASLVGRPFRPQAIGVREMIAYGRRWARSDEPGYDVAVWEPTRIFDWMQKRSQTQPDDGLRIVKESYPCFVAR